VRQLAPEPLKSRLLLCEGEGDAEHNAVLARVRAKPRLSRLIRRRAFAVAHVADGPPVSLGHRRAP
jgi:hypothetical protein